MFSYFKSSLLIWILVCSTSLSFAQVKKENLHSECIPMLDTLDGQKVHPLANKMPEYPGGNTQMLQFITDHIQSPKQQKNELVKGSVSITFVVDSAGRVRNPCLLREDGNRSPTATEKEMLRLFQIMPRWNAAVLNGRKTYVRLKMPIEILFK